MLALAIQRRGPERRVVFDTRLRIPLIFGTCTSDDYSSTAKLGKTPNEGGTRIEPAAVLVRRPELPRRRKPCEVQKMGRVDLAHESLSFTAPKQI